MLLSIKDLTCHYGVICALNHVNIEMKEAGILAIIGANGAGKSTLINSIGGIVHPTSGSIRFNDEELVGMPPNFVIRRGVAVCPEGRRIFKTVTVEENLDAGAYILNDKKEIARNKEMVYDFFPRLFERKRQQAGTLSGGELQMLAIGRALMPNPRLLLMDEPSMGLAPNLIDFVLATMERINRERNIPIVVVEQNSEMALEVCSRAYVLEVGNVVLEGTGKELLASSEVQKKYLGA